MSFVVEINIYWFVAMDSDNIIYDILEVDTINNVHYFITPFRRCMVYILFLYFYFEYIDCQVLPPR